MMLREARLQNPLQVSKVDVTHSLHLRKAHKNHSSSFSGGIRTADKHTVKGGKLIGEAQILS